MSSGSNVEQKQAEYSNYKKLEFTQTNNISYLDNQRDPVYFKTKIRHEKITKATNDILKICITDRRGLHPREFCRRWFGLEQVNEYGKPHYTEDYILAMESEHGYREKCINLIAKILKIKPNTIHRWGKGVEFDKIPADKRLQYEIYLGYVDSLRVFSMTLAELDKNSVSKLLYQLGIGSQN
ncbi:hypothetical protein LC653_32775 [Nostoc sp. CHAB 5784]|uniref:hypothetical protein n=1 Tax=Nostoc mirabile TaxID=2907820 RepID=UPI001E2D9A0D|nr:hypothetical protein [Nostoc mirabile]MCC5668496.1 hypothetical protein [Nostoc mirabile CHAB5784]